MKVLFVYLDLPADPKIALEGWGFYSEGLASMSSILKKEGYEVSLYHITKELSREEFLERIEKEKPDLIGFSVGSDNFFRLKKYSTWLKKRFKIPVICGGYHPTLAPDETINLPGVDMVCVGEGEYPLLELCKRIEENRPYEDIQSIWVKTDQRIIKNPTRPLIENLDDLPLPDFSIFDFEKLISSKISTGTVMISRGCPYNCSYCCNHAIKNLYANKDKYPRVRSPQVAIEYLKKLINHYDKIKYISFWDNNLSWPKNWCLSLLELYRKEIGLPFSCNLRADTIDEEIISALKKSGCFRVHIGVESGNKEIRYKILNRYMPDEIISKAFQLCRKEGINTLAYNMIGLPFETPRAALDTIKFNAMIRPSRALAAIFSPYRGTEATRVSLEAGFITLPIDYSKEVILKTKDFTEEEVKFFSSAFRPLMKIYMLIFKFPKVIRDPMEKAMDSFLCWKYFPYKLLTSLLRTIKSFSDRAKNILRNRLPKLYLFLRNAFLPQKIKF
ncbi:MAG: radical SAM protein [Patescibacteria group bacterium]|nr:radical SAM protein [Patescibacteria group bacterium]